MKRHQCLEKLILEGEVNGRRGRGRPRRSWDDDVAEWLKMDIPEAGRVAMDRGRYKRLYGQLPPFRDRLRLSIDHHKILPICRTARLNPDLNRSRLLKNGFENNTLSLLLL